MIDSVNCIPQMDEEGLGYFRNKLKLSQCYLEYGCGGSTIYACSLPHIKVVLSVDSDPAWVAKVKGSLKGSSSTSPPTLLLAHCDIGEVGDWGVPKNKNKSDHFWKYMAAPWDIARARNYVPDTILIDGRFRVACFLYSLLAARVGATIMFDDYFDRPHYFIVEKYCKLLERHGRMGVFNVTNSYSVIDLTRTIAEYLHRWE